MCQTCVHQWLHHWDLEGFRGKRPVTARVGSTTVPSGADAASPLEGLDILDTGAEPSFDALTEVAAGILGLSLALIVLVDRQRKWCKSIYGADWTELPAGPCFCDQIVASQTELVLIPDAEASGQASLLPEGMRFCAGVPLALSDGRRIGAFCVLDPRPRPDLGPSKLAVLRRLAGTAAALIEARGVAAELGRLHGHMRLSDALGGLALEQTDFPTAMAQASEVLGRHFDADLVTVTQYDPDAGAIVHVAHWSADATILEIMASRIVGRPLGAADTPSCAAIRDQRPLLLTGLTDPSRPIDGQVMDLLRQVGIDRYLVVPLRIQDARYGIALGFRGERPALEGVQGRIRAVQSRFVALFLRKQASDRQAFLSSILDQSGDGLAVLEVDEADPASRRFVYVNRAMTRLTGYAPDELIGAPVGLLAARADEPGMMDRARALLAAGKPAELETLNRRKQGDDIWLQLRLAPFRDPAGGRRVVAAARDVSERRAMMEELRALQSHSRRLFELNPVPMWLHDREDRRFLDVNDAALRQFGYSRADFLALRLPDLCRREDGPPASAAVGESGSEAPVWRLRTGRGEERVVTILARDFDGELGDAVLAAAIDVTRERRYEASLRHAKLQAEQANATKSEFLAHMSHEMRTPLNAIIGFSDMIRSGMHGPLGAPKYLDYVEAIQQSGNELLVFVNDVLQLIEMESTIMSVAAAPIELAPLVEEVLDGHRHAFAERDIRPARPDIPAGMRVRADLGSLRQVLGHVLDNVARFCAGATVEVRAEPLGSRQIALHVADTGPGIPDHVMDEIFAPFFTSRSMTRRSGQGAGLGLPICHRLLQAQGGEIRIDSRPGQGTTVTLCLPAANDRAG